MTKQKLCFEHGKDLKKSPALQNLLNCAAWELVDSEKCYLCKMELKLDRVLDLPQFRDLRP